MSALERVLALQPIQFRYLESVDASGLERAGFSAQQVREVIPEAVIEINGIVALDLGVIRQLVEEARKEMAQIGS
ncbi:MAG: tail fiber domain-containing protein [Rhodobacteraceae bacterium]|nr:tail fiber domain-containing protein [Paracoccaceae bacterium]